jgi:RNA polymerase sigma-70 factor, ECF subfamily
MADEFADSVITLLPNLRRYAISLCRSPANADDLVQTACEKAFANRGKFVPGTRLDAWLFRILRNSWIDQFRHQQKFGNEADIDEQAANLQVDGAAIVESRLTLQEVSDSITRLPDQQREIVMLICVEGLSYKEASELLGIPIGTIMSRLARARIEIARSVGIN